MSISKLIDDAQPQPSESKFEVQGTGSDSMAIDSFNPRVRTLEDAIAKAQVDTEKWGVDTYTIKHWDMGAKGPDNKICVEPMTAIKVQLKRKKGWSPEEFRKLLMDEVMSIAPTSADFNLPKLGKRNPILGELSIMDMHLGKLGWGEETNSANYDLKIAEDRYMAAAEDLLSRLAVFKPERIMFTLGSDFFHVDSATNTTTRGTPQDCDGRSQKAFLVGIRCTTKAMQMAARIAPVDGVVVSGNHDFLTSFHLGEVLRARFHNSRRITIQNTPDVWSYYRFGKVLIGLVHGDGITQAKRKDLPAQLASDRPKDWAECPFREIHMGHYHSELEEVHRFRSAEAIRDTVIRVLPSLSGVDAWHRQSGYKSPLAAELHMYHKDKGRYGYFVHSLEDKVGA